MNQDQFNSIRKEFRKAFFGSTLYFFLAGFLVGTATQSKIQTLIIGYLCVLIWHLFLELTVRKYRRAITIILLQGVYFIFWVFPFYYAATNLMYDTLPEIRRIVIGTGIISSFLGFVINLLITKAKLEKAQAHNLNSGKIDVKKGVFDFTKSLHFENPEKEKKLIKMVKIIQAIILPLMPFLASLLSSILFETDIRVVLASIMLVLVWGSILGFAKFVAISMNIKHIEDSIGKQLSIPRNASMD